MSEERTNPWINPERARFVTTVAKAFIYGGSLVATAFTVGRTYQQYSHQLAALESRIKDMPTRADLTEQRREYESLLRTVLEEATWWCPPSIRKNPSTWTECKASFQTSPAPPKR